MAERYARIEERIASVGQLSSVVAAIRGVAAARLRAGEQQLDGIRTYAKGVGAAIGEALALATDSGAMVPASATGRRSLVIALCSEQGFAGSFNSRVLDVAGDLVTAPDSDLFVVGDHGFMVASERGLDIAWSAPMAAHIEETAGLANRLADALYERVGKGTTPVTIVHASPAESGTQPIVTRRLIPFDFSCFPAPSRDVPPLLTLPPEVLLEKLAEEYVFAELSEAAMLSFAAENEARMRAMISAHDNIARRLDDLMTDARRARQEEITSEVVELAAGVEASRTGRA